MIKEFQDVRDWKTIRGIGTDDAPIEQRLQAQYQRVLQEVVEIHDAIVNNNDVEFMDAIGDTIVTLINIADTKGVSAEDCLKQAFDVIKYRKGLLSDVGYFNRYGKLSAEDKLICDEQQGNPGNEYFTDDALATLTPDNFKK